MRGAAGDGSGDLLGLKWVAGFPTNASAGLPAIHGTAILSDARTGVPRVVMDAGGITAQRTAAVSGAALLRWGPRVVDASGALGGSGGSGTTVPSGMAVAVIGAGVQARSHLPVIDHLLPGAALVLCDRDGARLATLADEVAAGEHGSHFRDVRTSADAAAAVDGASVVLTMVSFGPDRQSIPETAFAPHATVVAVDYDMCVPATLADGAALFLSDDREQFLANRSGEVFLGYPEPMAMIGEAISNDTARPEGRVLVSHLGAGLADVVFGDAILRVAESRGIGTLLER
jgi:ornithine cyclodeaminase/alanine dehydrogenase-like protein (mu-crystallin family)